MIYLEGLYWIISVLYYYLVIIPISLIMNIYYLIRLHKYIKNGKESILLLAKSVITIEEAIIALKVIIPTYSPDPLFGIINWFATPLVTYLRTIHLPNENYSKDCAEYSRALKYLIQNSKLKEDYTKIKVITLLSIKPLIQKNHTIVIAYRKDKYIDLFSPYEYLGGFGDMESIITAIEKYFNNKAKYSRFYIE